MLVLVCLLFGPHWYVGNYICLNFNPLFVGSIFISIFVLLVIVKVTILYPVIFLWALRLLFLEFDLMSSAFILVGLWFYGLGLMLAIGAWSHACGILNFFLTPAGGLCCLVYISYLVLVLVSRDRDKFY
jgi:hypothetical protein